MLNKPIIPHADLIRAVLDGDVVQRREPAIRGGEQVWRWVDCPDAQTAISRLVNADSSPLKQEFRLKPKSIVRWRFIIKTSNGEVRFGTAVSDRKVAEDDCRALLEEGSVACKLLRYEVDLETFNVSCTVEELC